MNCFIYVIYVIGVTDNPVKIGRAVSVERRLTALQIGNQDQLTVFARVPLPMGGSALVERGRKRAIDAARRGLNALSEWYGEAQEQKLLDEIYGNAA